MQIRYRPWGQDSRGLHVVSIGLRQLVFEDTHQGVLDVRLKSDVEWLLRHPSRQYELAYERYGVSWNAQGEQQDGEGTEAPPREVSAPPEPVKSPPPVPRRGRPPGRRPRR